MEIIIGIGEYGITNKGEDILKTFALATCVGITFYDTKKSVAAMIHIALPDHHTTIGPIEKPCYFASLGIPLILNKLEKEYGCDKNDLAIKLFGGAESIHKDDNFKIGKKNIHAIIHHLNHIGARYIISDIGGTISRTLIMEAATGQIKVITQPIKI